MTGVQDGKDASRYRDAGIAEALLRLGPDAAAVHPGVLANRGGVWIHHVRDGGAVEVREVSGAEPDALRGRIGLFQASFAAARSGPDDAGGDAFGQGLDRALGEVAAERPDLDAVELRLRDSAPCAQR